MLKCLSSKTIMQSRCKPPCKNFLFGSCHCYEVFRRFCWENTIGGLTLCWMTQNCFWHDQNVEPWLNILNMGAISIQIRFWPKNSRACNVQGLFSFIVFVCGGTWALHLEEAVSLCNFTHVTLSCRCDTATSHGGTLRQKCPRGDQRRPRLSLHVKIEPEWFGRLS